MRFVPHVVGGAAALTALAIWKIWQTRLPPGRSLLSCPQLLVGHRGCRLELDSRATKDGSNVPPENSLDAFAYALDRGAHGFELDTRLTKDGVAVVFHDAFIGRMVTPGEQGNVKVADLTLKDLQSLPFKNAPQTRVPTLDDAVALAKRRSAKIFIETKDIHRPKDLAAQVMSLIHKYDIMDEAIIISFDPRSLYYVRAVDPAVQTCLLWRPRLISLWVTHGREAVPTSWRIIAPLLDFVLTKAAHPAVLPSFLGVSALGPMDSFRHGSYVKSALQRGMATYLWVVNDTKVQAEVEGLASDGIFAYSTDFLFPRSSM